MDINHINSSIIGLRKKKLFFFFIYVTDSSQSALDKVNLNKNDLKISQWNGTAVKWKPAIFARHPVYINKVIIILYQTRIFKGSFPYKTWKTLSSSVLLCTIKSLLHSSFGYVDNSRVD